MKLHMTKKFKSLLLTGVFTLSLLFGGCSNNAATLGTLFNSTEKTNDSTSNLSSDSIPEGSSEATVERVVDGDTMKLKLKDSSETITIRLLLVDTPESVKPGVEPQPYSLEASNFAKSVLQVGDTVYVEYDEGSKTDKYDRHLGYLWYFNKEDNKLVMYNEEIIESGFARVGYIYSQKKHLDSLYDAQDKAKSSKLNIWSVPGYVTEKGFDVDAYNKGGSNSNSKSDTSTDTVKSDNNSTNNNDNNNVVFANGGSSTSNKYHSSKSAHGMKGAVKMTESKAKSDGYVPCGLCY